MADRRAPEQRTIDVDVQDIDTRGRRLVGYASVYNVLSHDLGGYREQIAPGAFDGVLDADVRALLNHDPNQVLGRTRSGTLRLAGDQRGLRFDLDLPDSPLGENVRTAVARGDIDGASFRFVVGDEDWQGDVRTVKTVRELHDVTIATFGAYPAASVELRTRAREGATMTETTTNTEPVTEERAVSSATPVGGGGATTGTSVGGGGAGTSVGGLRAEDRHAQTEQRTAERAFIDEMRAVRRGENRALTTSVTVSNTEISTTLFDRLRAASVMLSTGIRVLTTDSDSVQYPAITADATPAMYAEAATITPSDPTLGTVTATPRKMASLVQCSNESLEDSDPSLAEVVRDHLIAVMALKGDQQMLEGTGTAPEVRGLKNVTGIQTVAAATNGQQPTLDNFADAIALLEAVNVPPERIRVVFHPRNVATLRKAKASTAGTYLWGDPTSSTTRPIFGVRWFSTPQLSTNETQGTSGAVANSAYVFDVENVVFVRRTEIEIELDRSRLFNSDQSELRGRWRWDLIVPNPTAVVRVTGLLP